MAKKKNKKIITKNSTPSATTSSPTFSFEVSNTALPQTLPGGPYGTNPYQFHGPRSAFVAKTVNEGFYVRIDMPGVGKDRVEVKFEKNKLVFSGDAPTEYPFESGPRYYNGEITFSLDPLEVSDFKVDMRNGVLRVVLVGSGFPPNYNASSFHSSRKSHEVTSSCQFIVHDYVMTFERFKKLDPSAEFKGMYPFQLDGATGASEIRGLSDEYCFERVDMPDVESGGLTLRMRDRKMSYGGDGVKGSEYDEGKRLYFGEFVMQCPCACNLVEMHGEITDGVLRVIMKKEKVEATERIGHTNFTEAGPPR